MSKTKSTVTFELPKDFHQQLLDKANQEFTRAQHQWGVNVEHERTRVVSICMEQLAEKVQTIGVPEWFEFLRTIELIIEKAPWKGNINVPLNETDSIMYGHVHVERPRNTWCYAKEPTGDSLTLEEIPAQFWEKLQELIVTAVFYAVGSYKGGI